MQRVRRTTRAHLQRRACRTDDFRDPSVSLRVAESLCIAFVEPVWIGLDDKTVRVRMPCNGPGVSVRNEIQLALQIPMGTLDALPDSNKVNKRVTFSR